MAPSTINERATKPPIEPPTIAPMLGPSFLPGSVSTGSSLVTLPGSTVIVVVSSSDSVGVSVSVSVSSGSSVEDVEVEEEVGGSAASPATVNVVKRRPLWPS